MKIKLEGPITSRTGYGTASIEYIRGLRDIGHEMYSYPIGGTDGTLGILDTFRPIDDPDRVISHVIPENRKYDVLITVAEYKPVPWSWKYGMDSANLLITKSEHSKECLESMTDMEIKIVPDGVHESFGTASPVKHFKDETFRFLSIFEWVPRKQGELLLRSFCEEFTPQDDVQLWIKSSWGSENPLVTIPRILKDYPEMRSKIFYIKNHFNDISLLYKMFNGFVLPVAMEGFGRTFLEAIACGLKPIGPAAGGNMEFMTPKNSYLVECSDWELADHGKQTRRWAPSALFHPDAMWRVPLKDDLMGKMRTAFNERKRLSDGYVSFFKDQWSWERAVRKLSTILG